MKGQIEGKIDVERTDKDGQMKELTDNKITYRMDILIDG